MADNRQNHNAPHCPFPTRHTKSHDQDHYFQVGPDDLTLRPATTSQPPTHNSWIIARVDVNS
ncbi:hypothetical protein [Parafrankia sp. CH37]|uniref:hypothetical protein n=1 Tax=Parafrankia sp. CH37 TaxID=683308 RepID=UPI000B127674|nr:hypothetical protein [Parafrankia sp. CH37]